MERWNMDEAFYRLLEEFKKAGIKPSRDTVKNVIKRVCKVYGVTRESLGIIAGSRAVLYFEGESYSVGYDAILRLAEMGVDHICVEKDGICEILTDRAEKYGIALVNTRGHLTEYCEQLMIAAKKSGATVAIITDYEYTGIGIASEAPLNVHWIGVNDEMLDYFHLSREKLAVDAENKKSKDDVQTLVKYGYRKDFDNAKEKRYDDRFKNKIDLKFLASGQRIEINSVLAKVESERFFEYILYKLQQVSPTRDYTRVIDMPSEFGGGFNAILPRIIREVFARVESIANEAIAGKEDEITKELQAYKGVLEVEKKREEIQAQFTEVIEANENIKKVVIAFNKLLESGVLPNGDNLDENKLDTKYWKTGKKEDLPTK
ncbi:MAG: hypothetical protein WBL44_05215 [Nitrososphaeraceae archaeon]|jgi:hypothetical protein